MSTSRALGVSGSRGGTTRVVVVSQEPRARSQYDSRGRAGRCPSDLPGRLLPCSSWIGTRGPRAPKFSSRKFSEAEATARNVEAKCLLPLRALLPAVLRFTKQWLKRRARRSGPKRRPLFASKAHGLRARVLDARRPRFGRVGEGKLFARADRDPTLGSEHIRGVLARRGWAHTEPRLPRFLPAWDIGQVRSAGPLAASASRNLLAEARKDPANGGDERPAHRTATRKRLARVSSTGLGPLVRLLSGSLNRGERRCRCCSRRCVESMPGFFRRVFGPYRLNARNRLPPFRARCSRGPARATVISATCLPLADSRWCPSILPRGVRKNGPPAKAAAPPGPPPARRPGTRESAEGCGWTGKRELIPSRFRHLASFRDRDAGRSPPAKLNEVGSALSPARARRAAAVAPAGVRRPLVVGGNRPPLLRPV